MFPKRQRKRKKSQSMDEILEEFTKEISKELQPCQSEKQRKKDIVVRFKRDELGNRQTHTKYRDRSLSRKAACPGPCTSKDSEHMSAQPVINDDGYNDDAVVSGSLEEPTSEEQLENILDDIEEALANWDGKKNRSWCSRMEALNSTWEDHRKDIMEHVLTLAGNCPVWAWKYVYSV
ncbi:uncharacterized protein LOC114530388 [Dendronephthya gigantea]|uniref:uncharacterized protein LOC114530388 n=1 Tax=Dendronephthya gigantea TaxID=151771 RepID=UPI00106AF807|nr:uncharacterized protein LOC114530388 [Dendronephthya gigantea]